jgi:hypothetical protein
MRSCQSGGFTGQREALTLDPVARRTISSRKSRPPERPMMLLA